MKKVSMIFFILVVVISASCSRGKYVSNCKNYIIDKSLTHFNESYEEFDERGLDGYIYVAPYKRISKLDDVSFIINKEDNYTVKNDEFYGSFLYEFYIKDGELKKKLIEDLKTMEDYALSKHEYYYLYNKVYGETALNLYLMYQDEDYTMISPGVLTENSNTFSPLFNALFRPVDKLSLERYISFIITFRKIIESDNVAIICRDGFSTVDNKREIGDSNATFVLYDSYIIEKEKGECIDSAISFSKYNGYVYGFNSESVEKNSLILLNGGN